MTSRARSLIRCWISKTYERVRQWRHSLRLWTGALFARKIGSLIYYGYCRYKIFSVIPYPNQQTEFRGRGGGGRFASPRGFAGRGMFRGRGGFAGGGLYGGRGRGMNNGMYNRPYQYDPVYKLRQRARAPSVMPSRQPAVQVEYPRLSYSRSRSRSRTLSRSRSQ